MLLKLIAKGLLSYVPGIQKITNKQGTGGTNQASYCYGVWLKHLTLMWANGVRVIPKTLAEIGPGDSVGVGLAAILSGVEQYYALDVVKYSNVDSNLKIFDELVSLFNTRSPRPTKGWPDYDEYLDKNLFPSHILNDKLLEVTLSADRINSIREAIINGSAKKENVEIKYMAPWTDDAIIEKSSVDMLISHSVLEHVVDLEKTYKAVSNWLRPGAITSNQIDFTDHGLAKKWNGYRQYSEIVWKIIYGNRAYLINRQPVSMHIDLLNKYGFKYICVKMNIRHDGISRKELSPYWKNISENDLNCAGVFLQAIKP